MPGTTPIYGFPYPEPTDLVADYPALGQQLAEDVETEIQASGKVKQIVTAGKTDTFTTTSTSFVDITGLSVTITPSSATNSVLIMAMITGSNDAGVGLQYLRLMRGATAIAIGDAAGSRQQVTAFLSPSDTDLNMGMTGHITWIDNPATTSAVTYKLQLVTTAGVGNINRTDADTNASLTGRGVSSITAMEVVV